MLIIRICTVHVSGYYSHSTFIYAYIYIYTWLDTVLYTVILMLNSIIIIACVHIVQVLFSYNFLVMKNS